MGINLEELAYPHPVQFLDLEMDGHPLRMAYMDVAPSGQPNGRTVLLLHGKSFSGFYWESTIKTLRAAGYRVIVPDQLGFGLRDKLHIGSTMRAADYIAAQRRRRQIADQIDTLIRDHDALVTFGAWHVAPRLGVEPEMTAFTRQSAMPPFNLSSHPALVQCTGFTEQGLPLHWQVVGNRFEEATILQLAAAYEAATDWRANRAPVSGEPA